MNKLYAQVKNDLAIDSDVQKAIDGFEYFGYDIVKFTFEDIVGGKIDNIAKENPVVGSIKTMSILFKNINKHPEHINFPNSILNKPYLLKRRISMTKLKSFINNFKQNKEAKFVKPVQTKLFNGILILTEDDLSYFTDDIKDCDVFVSDPIIPISEHRIYVHNGIIIYSCNYSGDSKINPNYNYINSLIRTYKDSPISYVIDVAILNNNITTVVEFNDFWSIGSYGLHCTKYAQMLLARYNEILSI